MPKETKTVHGAVGIIFDKTEEGYSFLIMKRQGAWIGWQFVQGAIEKGENASQAVLREIQEEAGLKKISIAKELPYESDYYFTESGETIHKFLKFFLVKADKSEPVKVSREHSEYKWVSYEDTLKEIKFNKQIFQKLKADLEEIDKKGLQKGLGEF